MAAFATDLQRATRGRFDRVVGFQPMPGLDVLFLADHLRGRSDAPLFKRLSPRFRGYAKLESACFAGGSRTRIIGLARPQMQAFARRYPASRSRIAILPPTLTEERRKPYLRTAELKRETADRLGLVEGRPTWLWLGLQPHVKGLDRAIEALALAPEATLLVAGARADDRKLAPMIERAGRLGVAQRVRWLGYLAGDAVAAHFAAADVLAHPARIDVTGGVILEAIINGLPVVATDSCGFAPHIERSGAGKVVRTPFDVRGFAAALSEVCGVSNPRLSLSGIEYGQSADLYSGIAVACDLIEAASWPDAITMADEAVSAQGAA
jgi:UDP-glucose:(heptosyl)LPS alpha-1,3-glucosyltransferase